MHVTGGKEPRRGGMLVREKKGASNGYHFERGSKGGKSKPKIGCKQAQPDHVK